MKTTKQGVTGGNYPVEKSAGMVLIYPNDKTCQCIEVDAYQGAGSTYKKRETPLISIINTDDNFKWSGSFEDLVNILRKASNKTKVKFLINDGDLFAYFPEEPADSKGNFISYSHIGQHSACHPDYAKESRAATPQEYAALKEELESIGYELHVI